MKRRSARFWRGSAGFLGLLTPEYVLSLDAQRKYQRKAPLLPKRGARKGFPLWGKLSPQVTDEGEICGYRKLKNHHPVGAAYMPPAAAIPINQPNGQTPRDASMRSLQTCREFAFFPPLSLAFRQFVGRGLDPSFPPRGNCNNQTPSPGRGGALPRPRFCGNAKNTDWFVGAAYMPPVQPSRPCNHPARRNLPGKPHPKKPPNPGRLFPALGGYIFLTSQPVFATIEATNHCKGHLL